jgi:hypothetical protein
VSLVGPLDREVRRHVYDVVIARGLPPSAVEVAASLSVSLDQARAAFERLAEGRVLVLQRETREILMAMPFSAVPTTFAVRVGAVSYYGNCAWDALGISAMLKQDARVVTTCGCCATAMELAVQAGKLEAAPGIVHFGVPPRRFWDNVVFT